MQKHLTGFSDPGLNAGEGPLKLRLSLQISHTVVMSHVVRGTTNYRTLRVVIVAVCPDGDSRRQTFPSSVKSPKAWRDCRESVRIWPRHNPVARLSLTMMNFPDNICPACQHNTYVPFGNNVAASQSLDCRPPCYDKQFMSATSSKHFF